MAKQTDAEYFIGTDYAFVYTVLNEAETQALDIATWSLNWMVKKRVGQADVDAILTKSTGGSGIVVSGSYNVNPSVNTQVATVSVADTDTDGLRSGTYQFELKRMDSGFETVLAYGELVLIQPVHRS